MKRVLFGCAVALTALGSGFTQQPPPIRTVEVTADHDLKNVIVSIPMDGVKGVGPYLGVSEANAQSYCACQYLATGRLGISDGNPELLVLVPELRAKQAKTLEVRRLIPPAGPLPPFRLAWKDVGKHSVELRLGGLSPRPILRYTQFTFDPKASANPLTNPTIKPYHHVFDSTGKTLLTNGPDGKYPHHRGVYFGFNQISYEGKKADVWHCRNGESQRADPKQVKENGNLFGLHRLNVAWHGQDGGVFANEERELAAYEFSGATMIDFRSRLKTDITGGVKLDGDPQHAGFHFRASSAVEGHDKETYFLRPDGKGEPGKEINWDPKTKKGPVNLPWNAMSFVIDGKRYTVLYLDHPDNPKEARQSERTYGRIGTYFEYQLTPQKPLFVKYRLWIQSGEMTVEQCEALSKAFVEPVKVVVK